MLYDSIDLDLDVKIIVKINNRFHEGNIYLDDGMIAFCAFSSFLDDMDVSTKSNLDQSALFELFENYHSEVYDQIVEFYDKEDYLLLAEDIMKSITNKGIKNYCNRIISQMTEDTELTIIIEQLNQLIEDSTLDPSEIPLPEHNCIYETTRSLFFIRGRKSRTNPFIRRFTVAREILHYLKDSEFSVRIEFINSNLKVLFHVSEAIIDKDIKLIETRKILSNGDNSARINVPRLICKQFMNKDIETDLFIQLKGDLIEFLLCES